MEWEIQRQAQQDKTLTLLTTIVANELNEWNKCMNFDYIIIL